MAPPPGHARLPAERGDLLVCLRQVSGEGDLSLARDSLCADAGQLRLVPELEQPEILQLGFGEHDYVRHVADPINAEVRDS